MQGGHAIAPRMFRVYLARYPGFSEAAHRTSMPTCELAPVMEKTNLFNRLLKSLSEDKGFVSPGSGGTVHLTPYLSLIVAVLYMMAADDEISEQECNHLLSVFGGDQQVLQRALKYVESKSVDAFLAEAPALVDTDSRLCILLNVCDSSMSDGDFSKSEMILFSRMMSQFGYDKNSFKPYFDTLSLKNKHSVLGASVDTVAGELTPPDALIVAMLYMMSVDGDIAKEEIGQINVALRGSKEALPAALKYVKQTKFPDFMSQVSPILNHQQKTCILINVADCMLSDGRIDRLEQDLFRRMLKGFGLTEENFKKHFNHLVLKNDRPVDIRMASKSDKKSEIIQNTISTQDSMQFADEAVGSASENIKASSASAPGDRMAHEIVNQIDKNVEAFEFQTRLSAEVDLVAANARAADNKNADVTKPTAAKKLSIDAVKKSEKKSAQGLSGAPPSDARSGATTAQAKRNNDQAVAAGYETGSSEAQAELRRLRDGEGESDTRRLRDGEGDLDTRRLRDGEGDTDIRRLRDGDGDVDARRLRDADGESGRRRLQDGEGDEDRRQLSDAEGTADQRDLAKKQAARKKHHLRDAEGPSDLRRTSDGEGEIDFRTANDASADAKGRHLRDAKEGSTKKLRDSDAGIDASSSHDADDEQDVDSPLHVRMDYLKRWTGSLKDNLDEFDSIDPRHANKKASALHMVGVRPDIPAMLMLALTKPSIAVATSPVNNAVATMPWTGSFDMTEKNQAIATESAMMPGVDKTRKMLAVLTTGLIITQGFSSYGLSEAQNTFMTNQLLSSTTHMSVQTLTVQQGAFNLTADLMDHVVSKNESYSSDLRELSKTSAETYRTQAQSIESGTEVTAGKPSLNDKIKFYDNQSAIQLMKLKWFGLANGILMLGFFMSLFGLFFKSRMSVTGSSIVFILGTLVTLNGFYLVI
jgi:uncharacterized tellurite resistance protein B-like protein